MGLATVWLLRRSATGVQQAIAAEREAHAAAQRRFLHRLSHELNNVATVLQVGLGNLSSSTRGETGPPTTVANALLQIERLGRLTKGLGTLARLDALGVQRAPVDLGEVLAEAMEMARHAAGGDQRTVAVAAPAPPAGQGVLLGDRDLLVQAVYHLVDNALRFSAPGAAVDVRARRDGRWVAVEVADAGPGLTADDLLHAAEPLYRGRAARGGEGLGLGLPLAQRIAQVHGGRLELRNDARRGTRAILWLPLATMSSAHAHTPRDE
ncbi:MAG: HAMP domain-containing histidine kinase [Chloroflexi bacterium]|nr:HAMP domain-containing histidine kinase [Chloroflexota bacterium]